MKKWIIIFLGLSFALPAYAERLDFDDASRIAVQVGGRAKPMDTFAAESLQAIHGRRAVSDPETGQRLAPTEAILSIWLGTRDWKTAPIILVSDPAIREDLGLEQKRHFSFNELMGNRRVAHYFSRISQNRREGEQLTPLEQEAQVILNRLELFNMIQTAQGIAILPDPLSKNRRWGTPGDAALFYPEKEAQAVEEAIARFSVAFLEGKKEEFTTASTDLRNLLQNLAPESYPRQAALNREVHYNQLHPFRIAWIFYLTGFFFLLPRRTYTIGMAVFSVGLVFNVYGFVLRSWIAERAPVTNMYETVVWVALSLAVFAIIFEAIYRSRIYARCAAPMAVLALILADMLPTVLNPGINPLPPVLRDNFWLVTHVVTIMIGYAAFALAFAMGHYILLRYLLNPSKISEKSEVHYMLDRVLYLGIIFLAAGTILGGVWANYSWGRFWGWDPKETWSLIALLLYVFVSHGKIAGWWGHFGIAVGACLCFNGVLMTWYGVNFILGAGMHSYGFGAGGEFWVGLVVALDALFVGTCIAIKRRRDARAAPSSSLPSQIPIGSKLSAADGLSVE